MYGMGVAVGDYNNDGNLDLAVGTQGGPARVYLNHSTTLQPTAVFSETNSNVSNGLAWGDYDGDGHLDLAVARGCSWSFVIKDCHPSQIYRNVNGTLSLTDWSPPAGHNDIVDWGDDMSVAWGDYDNDGDADLAVGGTTGSSLPNEVFLTSAD